MHTHICPCIYLMIVFQSNYWGGVVLPFIQLQKHITYQNKKSQQKGSSLNKKKLSLHLHLFGTIEHVSHGKAL